MKARVGIITDFSMTKTPEEEREEIVMTLSWLGLEISEVVAGFDIAEVLKSNPDLVIVDYGGMSTSGAHDGARWNINYICRWAEDHPGKLVALWTHLTGVLYKHELEAEFGHLGNVTYPTGFSDSTVDDKIKAWFGLS